MNPGLLRTLVLLLLSQAAPAAEPGPGLVPEPPEIPGPAEPAPAVDHPVAALMDTVTWRLRPELQGVHPRVFLTEADLARLRARARTTHRALWQEVTANLGALRHDPPPPPAQERRAQNTVAIELAEVAFAWAVDRDPRYLAAARRHIEAALSYEVWGYVTNKPDVDLAAGHLLYGLAWAYDLLYEALTPVERARIRAKLVRQGELLAAHLAPEAGRSYPYAQNHHFIPVAGLAVAGYALQGEAPEAEGWSKLARALYDRVLTTYSPDGYYYEGVEYWIFSTPWIVRFLDAHAHATGEDLYDRAPGLRAAHLYLAHATLPGGHDAFDFGDAFLGAPARAGLDPDRERTHPGGHFETNYNLLYRLADRFDDADVQGVADHLEGLGQQSAEAYWSLIWRDPDQPATPIDDIEPWHHFEDHDVLYWRTDWGPDATALAFKCGPPHGHEATAQEEALPDWRLSAGHAHPDAASFILYARGAYLTGDSGYAGVPRADQHNTLLFDGQGQAAEGQGHDAWKGYPYARLDTIHLSEVILGAEGAFARCDATGAYDEALGVTRFTRSVLLPNPDTLTITDDVETVLPRAVTSLLHFDGPVRAGGGRIAYEADGASLSVRVLEPRVRLVVEPNVLVGPGVPGAIGEGAVEVRGERVRITPLVEDTYTRLRYRLRVGP